MCTRDISNRSIASQNLTRAFVMLSCSACLLHEPTLFEASLKGYGTFLTSFRITMSLLFFVVICSTHTCLLCSAMNRRMKTGSHRSLAIPRSLQQRMRALDLQPSVAVGIPSGSKYCCSPRAMLTSLRRMSVGLDKRRTFPSIILKAMEGVNLTVHAQQAHTLSSHFSVSQLSLLSAQDPTRLVRTLGSRSACT